MNLTTALRMGSTPRVALVGGGGKTTTMFTLARAMPSPVITAATAHMAIEQLALADQHFFVNDVCGAGSACAAIAARHHVLQRIGEFIRQDHWA